MEGTQHHMSRFWATTSPSHSLIMEPWSFSTVAFNIHENPEVFLCVLLSVSTASMASIRFDKMVFWDSCEKKRVLVAWKGSSESNQEDDLLVFLEQLIFISDALHGCSTTVWAGSMKNPTQKSR